VWSIKRSGDRVAKEEVGAVGRLMNEGYRSVLNAESIEVTSVTLRKINNEKKVTRGGKMVVRHDRSRF